MEYDILNMITPFKSDKTKKKTYMGQNGILCKIWDRSVQRGAAGNRNKKVFAAANYVIESNCGKGLHSNVFVGAPFNLPSFSNTLF